ncbi:MAG: alpha/beta fold hydrolase [Dehalococcoidia bacterium]
MAERTAASATAAMPAPGIFNGGAAFTQMQEELQRSLLQSIRTFEVLTARDEAKVGQTPKDVIWKRGVSALYHYRATTETVHPLPLLMVHSLISKPYILDLIPGNSFIEYLVSQGFDVYLIDWGTPRPEDKELRLESYALDLIPAVIEIMQETSDSEDFSLFGYCMGGLLALLYAATHPDAPLRNLVTLATPVDFKQMGLNTVWTDQATFDVDKLVDTFGNVPANMLMQSFRMLKPASEVSPVKYVNLWQNVLNDRFVAQYRAFDQWTTDHIPFPGECFRQTNTELMKGNKLVTGELELTGKPAALANITCSFLTVAAQADHIVPLAATEGLIDMVGSTDKEFVVMPGGHVGLAAGRKAVQTLWPKVAAWLGERSELSAMQDADAAETNLPEIEIVVERVRELVPA